MLLMGKPVGVLLVHAALNPITEPLEQTRDLGRYTDELKNFLERCTEGKVALKLTKAA